MNGKKLCILNEGELNFIFMMLVFIGNEAKIGGNIDNIKNELRDIRRTLVENTFKKEV